MAERKGIRVFYWAMLGLVVVGLVGFGSTSLTGTIRSIGTVGDKQIGLLAYSQALTAEIRAFEAQIGTTITFADAQALGIDQSVLNQVIGERTLDNEAALLGLSVGDRRVAAQVQSVQAFQGLDGQFDRVAYADALRRAGLTETDYETSLRESMTRSLLQAAVVAGVPQPGVYADTLAAYIGETRSITWARVSVAHLTAPLPSPTEADLAAFHADNAALFTRPEVKAISYAWLTPDMIADEMDVDDQALAELYQSRIDEFVVPERRLVERLAFADTDAATAAMARITAGEADFDALVAERGLDLADVDLGDVTETELAGAGALVFLTGAGQVVGPLDSPIGPALFRVNAVLNAQETTLQEATPDLRIELATARARRYIEDQVDALNDLLAGGATVADLTERSDLEAGQIDWDATTTAGIAAYEAFRDAAAAAQPGDYPQLVGLDDGGVFVLQVDEVRPPALIPIDEVRAEVTQGWREATIAGLVLEEAQRLAAQTQPVTEFETLGLAASQASGLTRRGFVEGAPEGFLTEVFAMQPGEARAIANPGADAILVRLDAVTPADTDDPGLAETRAALAEQAAAGIAGDIFTLFNGAVQLRTEVKVDAAAVAAVHAQFQ